MSTTHAARGHRRPVRMQLHVAVLDRIRSTYSECDPRRGQKGARRSPQGADEVEGVLIEGGDHGVVVTAARREQANQGAGRSRHRIIEVRVTGAVLHLEHDPSGEGTFPRRAGAGREKYGIQDCGQRLRAPLHRIVRNHQGARAVAAYIDLHPVRARPQRGAYAGRRVLWAGATATPMAIYLRADDNGDASGHRASIPAGRDADMTQLTCAGKCLRRARPSASLFVLEVLPGGGIVA